GDTSVTFTFTIDPVTAEGPQSLQINASAFNRASDSSAVSKFTSSFYYDATPLTVTSMSPSPGSFVALPFTTIDVNLNGAIDPASVQTSDLSITKGSVTGFALLNSNTTVRFTISNIVNEDTTFVASVAAGAFADANGNVNAAFAGGNYTTLDYS